MQIDVDVISKLASPAVTFLIWLWGRLKQDKSKLVVFYGHISTFTIAAQPPVNVFAHSIVVRNMGNKPATNVRVQHRVTTENFRIDPPYDYERTNHPQGGFELKFEHLLPKTQMIISYLYLPPLMAGDIGGFVRSDEEVARQVNPFALPPVWLRNSLLVLALIGLAFVLYWPIRWIVQQVVLLLAA